MFAVALAVILSPATHGFLIPERPARFEGKLVTEPSFACRPAIRSLAQIEADPWLSAAAAERTDAWKHFRGGTGERWSVWLDTRSGAPALVQGEGIPWIPGSGNLLTAHAAVTLDSLATSLRAYVRDRADLFIADESELVLDRKASAQVTPDLWLVVFTREVSGVPVEGDGYVFYVGHGNLISFGSPRWSRVVAGAAPGLDRVEAWVGLREELGIGPAESFVVQDPGTLEFSPFETPATSGVDSEGAFGEGYGALLTWKYVFGFEGEAETWVARVDARTGRLVDLHDDTKYAQVKGGIYPFSNDGACPNGCEQAGFPMPFANLTVNGNPAQASDFGRFSCSGGNAVMTMIGGPYVRVTDTCGLISQSVACDNDLDLGVSTGTDCSVPAGSSFGNTHAARTSFFHLNRAMEHGRGWLPGNAFLSSQVQSRTNAVNVCNAFNDVATNTLTFYRETSACRNTGEIAGVMDHEWGHLLSAGDGAGASNPDEAYGDITAFMITHASCIGQGIFKTQTCTGYGNACLNCRGVRDVDFAQRASGLPTTPSSVLSCPLMGVLGPCARLAHCESYIVTEALWDLVRRDLPGSGIDASTAWVMADRLWFLSRQGSSGNAYACGSPASTRSCAATHWMQQLRAVDDDDGNLANGTPHAAAIFAAFNRHEIPCGAASDLMNQSFTTCPALTAPILTASPGSETAQLAWPPVANAASYRILRNDLGCGFALSLETTIASTQFTDTGLVNGRPEYYAVQAVGSNSSCASPLSSCVPVTAVSTTADLQVSMTDTPDPVAVQQALTYDISVANLGPGLATNVTLLEQVTPAAPFVSIAKPSGWSCTTPSVGGTGSVSCTGPSIPAGAGAVFSLVVRPRGCLGNGTIVGSTASVSSTGDPASGNNSTSTTTTVLDDGTCEDGDPCTSGDHCVAGACQPGPTCPAPNSCQSAACVTGVGCVVTNRPAGTPCEAGDPCTADSCLNGACLPGPPAPPDEVGPYLRIDKVSNPSSGGMLSFNGASGTTFSLYLGWRQFNQPWIYNQTCRVAALAGPVLLEEVPPQRDAFYYLMTRRESCGESILGRSSAGTVIPNTSPCP